MPYPIADWGVFEATANTQLGRSLEEEGVALIAQSLLDRLDDLSGNESNEERSDPEDGVVPEATFSGQEFSLLLNFTASLTLNHSRV